MMLASLPAHGQQAASVAAAAAGEPVQETDLQPEAPEPTSPLVPEGEAQRMAPRPVESLSFKAGKGLTAKSRDGDFELSAGVRVQFLYQLEHDNAPGGVTEHSFQIRRARVSFQGHFWGEKNRFRLQLGFSSRDEKEDAQGPTQPPLLAAYVEFDHLRDLSLRVGQYRLPFSRQRMISSGSLQLVDRSIVTSEFGLARDIGLDLRSTNFLGLDRFAYYAGIYAGEGRNAFQSSDFGMMYLARVEFLPFGRFETYVESDFERTGPRLSLAASYGRVENAQRDRGNVGSVPLDAGTTDFNLLAADALFKFKGLSVFGEAIWREGKRNSGPLFDEMGAPILDDNGNPISTAPTRDGLGFMLQAGYLLPRTAFEVAGRYAAVLGSDDAGFDALADREELTGGVNYYFAHHRLKLQADYSRLVDRGHWSEGVDRVRVNLQASL